MKPYIYTERNGIYIIDLKKNPPAASRRLQVVRDTVAEGGKVMFIGTKNSQGHYRGKRPRMRMLSSQTAGLAARSPISAHPPSIEHMLELERMIKDGSITQYSKKDKAS
jgi:small subunit ribosomal protein S2